MIFLTVGTYPLQFDRLVEVADNAVRDGLVDEEIFAQTGVCNYRPKHMQYATMLEKSEFDEYFKRASRIIGHAGMGTIAMALEQDKPLLVMARKCEYKEHVNDHQVSTAEMMEKLGHILVAHNAAELPVKLNALKSFAPAKRDATPQLVADRVARFLIEVLH